MNVPFGLAVCLEEALAEPFVAFGVEVVPADLLLDMPGAPAAPLADRIASENAAPPGPDFVLFSGRRETLSDMPFTTMTTRFLR